tara:strand:- start:82696 stop:83268 length:573 start_codon:yes stop_codon:yes gene_type:complete
MLSWTLYYKKVLVMLNIALIVSEEDAQSLNLLSKGLNKQSVSSCVLGENTHAHITLAHIDAGIDEAEYLWQRFLEYGIPLSYSVVLKSFCIDAPHDGRVYTSFLLEEWGKLSKIQDKVLNIVSDYNVHSEVGVDFRPHITLSCHECHGLVLPKLSAVKPPFKRVQAYLCIGTRESNGRMDQVLFKQEIEG